MRVIHFNCGTLHPLGGAAFLPGRSGACMPCHCLLLLRDSGSAVLVDTGLGLQDVARPTARLGRFFVHSLRPELRREETAFEQLRLRGIAPEQVTDIVLTHLDPDHAGGLADFPWATVHVGAEERDAALARATRVERSRYRVEQWSHEVNWRTYEDEGEPWLAGLAAVPLAGLPELRLVPLFGHTRGHCGVAVRLEEGRWLLHAGDAYTVPQELCDEPPASIGLWVYRQTHVIHWEQWRASWEAVRRLARHEPSVNVLGTHDFAAYAALRCP